jgi:chitinase
MDLTLVSRLLNISSRIILVFNIMLSNRATADNESHNPTGYTALATSLRNLYATDTSKSYYLSGAPQCPIPDASIPLAAMLQMDFVWVQFYNNPSCNVGSSGFISSIQAWSSQLNNGTQPMLFLGAEAETGDGASYIPIADLQGNITSVKALNLPNFGGVNLWDGSQAVANGNFQDGVKSALTG